jgi:hypothetical protein
VEALANLVEFPFVSYDVRNTLLNSLEPELPINVIAL